MDKKLNGVFFVRLFWITIISSFLAWFIALLINPQGRQLDLFFLRMGDFWADATNTTGLASCLDPYHNDTIGLENAVYPPLAYVLFEGLAFVSVVPKGTYLQYYYQPIWTFLFVIALIVILVLLFVVCLKQFKAFCAFDGLMLSIALCLSYPMLFVIERGNILILSSFAVAVYLFYYDSKSKWKKEIAIICLSLAIGIKLSPAVLGVLLINKKDWKTLCRAFLYGIFFIFFPFLFFDGDIQTNLLQMVSNIQLHFKHYSEFIGTGLISSYTKYGLIIKGEQFQITPITYHFFKVLKILVSILLSLGIFFLQEKWKKALNATLILLILPSVSGAYCMIYMIPVTVLFMSSLIQDKITVDKLIILLSLIMIFFVYRCDFSIFFNFSFAIPVLVIMASNYSIKSLRNSKKFKICDEW